MSQITEVKLDLAERSYAIHIGKSLLENAVDYFPADLRDNLSARKIFILYDKNVYPYVQVLDEALAGKAQEVKSYAVKGGEPSKSYSVFEECLGWLLENKVNRQSILIAVGGGVVGDLGGFVASVAMRGIPYIQVPTTLLSQVDSSVGGKTGINTAQGKNLVGSFYQPKSVICDIGTLGTLPEREMRAGYAEVVKYGLINNLPFFEWLEENGEKVLALEEGALTHAIKTSCESKAAIVAEDEREGGKRALLNLGHTFGHALEAAAGYDGRLLHGEGVSIGMMMAFALSMKMGLCAQEDISRVEAHLVACNMLTKAKDITPALKHSADDLYELMLGDKKMLGSKIGFILTRGIGQAFQMTEVSMNDVIKVTHDSLEGF